jgi:hypothetical protein
VPVPAVPCAVDMSAHLVVLQGPTLMRRGFLRYASYRQLIVVMPAEV